MIRSMTAFARSTAEIDQGQLAWEIRSVNHRYLELGLRLPEEFRALEPGIRERVGSRVQRGKLELALHFRPGMEPAASLELDKNLLDELVKIMQEVSRKMGQATPSNPVDLMRWPGLLREPERDLEPLHAQAMETLDQALEELVAARAREGERIAAGIRARAEQIRGHVEAVRKRLPEVHASMRDRLVKRIEEFGVEADPERLEQELAVIAQKLDVSEELERLDGHVTELESALKRDEPAGRRLDFLLQEFNREANTLGSKSQDAVTTKVSVELKVLIEQIREQVQNVE